jgi:hypothetical protein
MAKEAFTIKAAVTELAFEIFWHFSSPKSALSSKDDETVLQTTDNENPVPAAPLLDSRTCAA